tara:strand:+ start:539 stop:853 length:315 start_codon:yes stop_codon:yes gene_type:complete
MVTDYSKTYIYSLEPITNINKELFILYSSDVERRWSTHKYCSTNSKAAEYNRRIYSFIRCNGGIENWTYKLLKFITCKNREEAELLLDLFIIDLRKNSECTILN